MIRIRQYRTWLSVERYYTNFATESELNASLAGQITKEVDELTDVTSHAHSYFNFICQCFSYFLVLLLHPGNVLNLRIGRKGDISKLTDYWDVATFFEVRVLLEEYTSAVRAVERIYAMDPPIW